jgi:hypothetical protein
VQAADDQCPHYDFASGLNASAKNIHFYIFWPNFHTLRKRVAFMQLIENRKIQLLSKPMMTNYANAQATCIPGTTVGCGEKFQTLRCRRRTDSRSVPRIFDRCAEINLGVPATACDRVTCSPKAGAKT